MIDGYPELNLINPLTRAQIQLPPIDTFPDVLGYRPYRADEEYLILRVRPNLPKPAKVQVESIAYVRDVFINKLHGHLRYGFRFIFLQKGGQEMDSYSTK